MSTLKLRSCCSATAEGLLSSATLSINQPDHHEHEHTLRDGQQEAQPRLRQHKPHDSIHPSSSTTHHPRLHPNPTPTATGNLKPPTAHLPPCVCTAVAFLRSGCVVVRDVFIGTQLCVTKVVWHMERSCVTLSNTFSCMTHRRLVGILTN